MSVYKMTLGELAKKEGKPVADFIKEINEKGFATKGASQKLKQEDLDAIAALFHEVQEVKPVAPAEDRVLTNPNVLLIENNTRSFTSALVDVKVVNGKIELEVVESVTSDSKGEALLEYKRLRGLNHVESIR